MQRGLTPTTTLRYINRMLGSIVQEIELTEEEIMRVVFQETLLTFSKYYPYVYQAKLTNADLINKSTSRWRIPNDDKLTIMGVHKAFSNGNNHNIGGLIPYTMDPFDSQITRDIASMTMTRFTWEFFQPNEFTLKPVIINSRDISVFIKAVHPQHLKTIGLDMRDVFLQLALYDVLISLYPIRHRFENMNTAYGQIQPFLEMVDSAKGEREELINTLRTNLLHDSTGIKMFLG